MRNIHGLSLFNWWILPLFVLNVLMLSFCLFCYLSGYSQVWWVERRGWVIYSEDSWISLYKSYWMLVFALLEKSTLIVIWISMDKKVKEEINNNKRSSFSVGKFGQFSRFQSVFYGNWVFNFNFTFLFYSALSCWNSPSESCIYLKYKKYWCWSQQQSTKMPYSIFRSFLFFL